MRRIPKPCSLKLSNKSGKSMIPCSKWIMRSPCFISRLKFRNQLKICPIIVLIFSTSLSQRNLWTERPNNSMKFLISNQNWHMKWIQDNLIQQKTPVKLFNTLKSKIPSTSLVVASLWNNWMRPLFWSLFKKSLALLNKNLKGLSNKQKSYTNPFVKNFKSPTTIDRVSSKLLKMCTSVFTKTKEIWSLLEMITGI
jgi:hypothetical protein